MFVATSMPARGGLFVRLAVLATILGLVLPALTAGMAPVAAGLVYDASDEAWHRSFPMPAGSFEYKAALNDSWNENYGLNATSNGANIPLTLAEATDVRFYYSHATHWATDSVNGVIAVAPGSFQSELGCPGDWQPDCLRSWLQDPDGDGVHEFTTTALPAGSYETKVAHDETWDENYGAGGVFNGPNIGFTVPADNAPVTFEYDAATHVLTVDTGGHGHDNDIAWDGVRHDSRSDVYRTPGGAVPAGTPDSNCSRCRSRRRASTATSRAWRPSRATSGR
jgi:hypothetical protein